MATRMLGTADRKVVLSSLWVFVVFNYLYADFMVLIFRPGAYQAMAARMTVPVVLGASLLFEFLVAMVFLPRVLEHAVNRWVNIVAGLIGTAFVAVTLNSRAPAAYLLLSSIEMVCTLFIVWYAWTWRSEVPRATPSA